MKKSLLFIYLLCFATFAQASYKTIISEQVIEEKDERKARSQAIDKATSWVTTQMIKKEIGEQRYNQNKNKINTQVKPLKNRFIPFFKILKSTKEGQSYRFNIEVKVSQSDLRLVLRQKGLFASQSKTGITLPFIEFNNQLSGESFRWWAPVFSLSKQLENLSFSFEKELFQGFLDKGLFLLRPQAFHMEHALPPFLRKTELTETEMVQITNLKKGQLYVDGRVDLISSPVRENAYRLRIQLSCKQASNGKSVAEVVRTLDTAPGKKINQIGTELKELAKETGLDIAGQVFDLWQRGGLESQVLKLAVTGDLNHQQLNRFKKVFEEKMGLRNGMTERLFEPGRVTFEMDYEGGVESLHSKLKRAQFEGFISQVVSSNADQITLDVKVSQ